MKTKSGEPMKHLYAAFLALFAAILISFAIPNTATAAGCCDVAGDADSNGVITIADPLLVSEYLFGNAATPSCLQRWDADGSGKVTVRDIVRLVRYVIGGGTAPICPATELSYEERLVVFNSIDSVETALGDVSPDSLATVLFDFMSGVSDFESVGREGNSIWAYFTDGRMVFISNNRFPSDSARNVATHPIQLPDSTIPANFVIPERNDIASLKKERNAKQSVAAYEMPESVDAHVITTLGASCFSSATEDVKTLLSQHGYAIASTDGSVIGLLNNVRDAGLFYIDAHGGGGRDRNNVRYVGVIWTNTLRSKTGDSVFQVLLNDFDLVYMKAKDLDGNGDCKSHWRYAFTEEFVKNFMTFEKNSFVLINTCHLAGDFGNQGFFMSQGFKDVGVSVYAGWSNAVTDDASDLAGEFLIDRMLGANASNRTPVESPKQRPFGITMLKQDMHNRGFDVDPDPPTAELIITKLQDGFELLAPSIRFVEVINYTDTLFLTGYFGSDPGVKGHVYVDGVEQTIYKWDSLYIWASIPQSGVGSSGPVTVVRDGDAGLQPLTQRKSNPVNLTDWYGTFTYTENNAGTLQGKVEIHAHIRADVHAFREAPHTTPAPNQFIVFGGVKDSDGDVSASGTFVYPIPDSDPYEEYTWAWGGSDSLGWVNQPDPQGILIQGSIQAHSYSMELFINGSGFLGSGETVTSSLNGPQRTSDLLFMTLFELYDEIPFTLYIGFDAANWNIIGGERNKSTCCSVDPDNDGLTNDVAHKIKWDDIPASFGPDPTAPQ